MRRRSLTKVIMATELKSMRGAAVSDAGASEDCED